MKLYKDVIKQKFYTIYDLENKYNCEHEAGLTMEEYIKQEISSMVEIDDEKLKLSENVVRYMNEINHNCFTEREIHEESKNLWTAIYCDESRGRIDLTRQYFETLNKEAEVCYQAIDKETMMKIIKWKDEINRLILKK